MNNFLKLGEKTDDAYVCKILTTLQANIWNGLTISAKINKIEFSENSDNRVAHVSGYIFGYFS